MAAVLERPGALLVERPGPVQQLGVSGGAPATVSLLRSSPVALSTAAAVWVDLCGSAPITIMCLVPSLDHH